MSPEATKLVIRNELATNCHGRPTKRLALQIAEALLDEREAPQVLWLTQCRLDELKARLATAKV